MKKYFNINTDHDTLEIALISILDDFVQRFRLQRHQVDLLENTRGGFLQHGTHQNHALSARQQMLLTLRYLADGGRLRLVGDAHGVDKSTMSRVIERVTTVINEQLFGTMVNWPNEPGSIANISARFRLLAGMPFVIGCMDGTHVPIVGPHENEPQFVNRHGTHSINCMAVAGPDFKFYYVSCKWPGSVADARVYRNSTLSARLENWRPIANFFNKTCK